MKKIATLLAGLVAGIVLAGSASAQALPDLGGKIRRRRHRERLFPAPVRRPEDQPAGRLGI